MQTVAARSPSPDSALPAGQTLLDLDAFTHTPLQQQPYQYCVVEHFIRADQFQSILSDYPAIPKRGSFPLDGLHYGPRFTALLDELQGPAFRHAVEAKFGVDLTGRPTMVTVRGKCGSHDGRVHTDTESKIITVLLYMNADWDDNEGGRLRVLSSPNLDDYAAEIPPANGTMMIFRRSDHSWHGHKPFTGERKVLQLNWVTEQKFADRNHTRHRISSWFKKLNPFASEY